MAVNYPLIQNITNSERAVHYQLLWVYLGVFGCIRVYFFGCIWAYLFGCIWVYVGVFWRIWVYLGRELPCYPRSHKLQESIKCWIDKQNCIGFKKSRVLVNSCLCVNVECNCDQTL